MPPRHRGVLHGRKGVGVEEGELGDEVPRREAELAGLPGGSRVAGIAAPAAGFGAILQ